MRTVAVLCAAADSVYRCLPGVEVYDETRDCRSFAGGIPVVAHPPCRAWSAYCAHQAKPISGERDLAPFCVEQLSKFGGVLEHPAHSRLWKKLNLPPPGKSDRKFATIWIEQSWFGDLRSKQTWLLLSGIDPREVETPYRLHDPRGDRKRWNTLSKRKRAATPPAMAEWLVLLARQSILPPSGKW